MWEVLRLRLRISPAGSRYAHARKAAQVRFPVALPKVTDRVF